MNIWRVKSKTGKLVHLTSDRKETFCGYEIKDDWTFIYPLKSRTEALEQSNGLCSRCNETNLEEWEEEEDNEESEEPAKGVRI